MCSLFSCDIRKTIQTIYKNKELGEAETMKYVKQANGISYDAYNLEMVIAIAFRICSKESKIFRRFVMDGICVNKKETQTMLLVSYSKGTNRWYC